MVVTESPTPTPEELHVLTSGTREYRSTLSSLGLEGRFVLEVGAGTGVLTQWILDCDPAFVVAYEILPGLCTLRDPRLDLREQDFLQADLSFLEEKSYALVCNPPYALLPYLYHQVIQRYTLADVLIMSSRKKASLFEGFEEAFSLSGDCFNPPTSGDHVVLRRGFPRGSESRMG